MPKIDRIINAHNQQLLDDSPENVNNSDNPSTNCNCHAPDRCPMQKHFVVENVVYKATTSSLEEPDEKKYT